MALQVSWTNLTAHAVGVGTDVIDLSGLISYHVTAHVMIGFQGERVLGHNDFHLRLRGDISGGERFILSVAQ
ncbi:MAG: hypothetical protein M3Z37_06555 [Candidatus Eremiobacteraeota bacterium]|nr:hypothetical protein [Candidatus Eremiobacteraeota bacterium]